MMFYLMHAFRPCWYLFRSLVVHSLAIRHEKPGGKISFGLPVVVRSTLPQTRKATRYSQKPWAAVTRSVTR